MVYFNNFKKNNNKNTEAADPKSYDFIQDFLKDWENVRDRHKGQKAVLNSFFNKGSQYIFLRAGRKFSKTTCDIDIAWRFAIENPNSVIYMCYPTITQAIEILWDEKRLQHCDLKDDWMFKKYVKKTDDSKHMLWFVNGSHIKLIGTWTEARGRGTQPDLLLVDEVQDASGQYLDAMDPNLAAKNGRCVMSGTPPKKRNHYHDWEERIRNNPKGELFHFSSYANDKLPHLEEWLNNKRDELIKTGKKDIWEREYLAIDCFSSADRVLPDANFIEPEKFRKLIDSVPYKERIPLVAIGTQGKYCCAILCTLESKRKLFVKDYVLIPQVWDKSYAQIYKNMEGKIEELERECGNRMRRLLWDPTNSFKDVIRGFTDCRKDFKWQDRGMPLLKDMMIEEKIVLSENIAPFGLECQNLLMDETKIDIEKNYPLVSTLSMVVNEHFQREKLDVRKSPEWDKYAALREAGLPCPTPRKKGKIIYRQNW